MAFVRVNLRENTQEGRERAFEQAVKAFKRQVDKEGILKDLRKQEAYVPPSIAKREKQKEAIKRANKLAAKKRRTFRSK